MVQVSELRSAEGRRRCSAVAYMRQLAERIQQCRDNAGFNSTSVHFRTLPEKVRKIRLK
jgi:hypothetical protein